MTTNTFNGFVPMPEVAAEVNMLKKAVTAAKARAAKGANFKAKPSKAKAPKPRQKKSMAKQKKLVKTMEKIKQVNGKWQFLCRGRWLGSFDDKEQAIKAYLKSRERHTKHYFDEEERFIEFLKRMGYFD